MGNVIDGIIADENEIISFGNYEAKQKIKAKCEASGNEYAVKTHSEITRLEKNGMFIFESVPGSAIQNFKLSEDHVIFSAKGIGNTQITLGLLPEKDYKLKIDGCSMGLIRTNRSGKFNFSVELGSIPKNVMLEICN